MNYEELLAEVKNPEKETCELKSSFSDWGAIARTVAAFSTAKGGKIFIGIDKHGCPIGTTCNNEIKGKLQTLANNEITPPTYISSEIVTHDPEKDSVIVCILVQRGNSVYSYKGVHYERRDDTNHPLTADEIFELQKNLRKIYFDEFPSKAGERPGLVSDIDDKLVRNYLEEVKPGSTEVDKRRFLTNNSLTVGSSQKVKNGAIMLFGTDPQKFVPQLKVSISIFPTNVITNDFVNREVVGTIFDIFEKAYLVLRRNIQIHSFVEGARRYDIPEYPEEVIRECLINSIVHRDYFHLNTETFIKVFSDRIEFVNPASFPFENVTFDEIRRTKISKRRNPKIAEFFEAKGHMEKEGRGISIIEEGAKEHGLPAPNFEVTRTTFMVTLYNAVDKNQISKSPNRRVVDYGSLNDRQMALVQFLNTYKGSVGRAEYIAMLKGHRIDVPSSTASKDLDELVKKNVLTKKGEKRGTKYFLT